MTWITASAAVEPPPTSLLLVALLGLLVLVAGLVAMALQRRDRQGSKRSPSSPTRSRTSR